MTGRERLAAILSKQPTDRLSWTALVDGHTLGALPSDMQGMSGLEFYRHLGCDVLELNGWDTGIALQSPELMWDDSVRQEWRVEGNLYVHELTCGGHVLTGVWRSSHPRKHLVETLEDLHAYRTLWEGARYLERDDTEAFAAINKALGDDGVVTRFWGPSTIPRLLETDFGTQSFYYLLHDHPADMHALIELMHERELEAFRILARGPWDSVTLVENTSTWYISPDVYRRYNGPHVRDFVDAMHEGGKCAIIHMCGHVRGLLADIKATGADGVHALTPPPTGDTPWELALDVLGEETIIFGSLDPTVKVLGPIEGIAQELDRLYTPRLRRAHFCLVSGADGIVVPLERFEAVADWFRRNGALA